MSMRPLGKVSTQWSPNLAYAVGLLATDGSLSKDGRHIDFTSKDRQLVVTFRSCLGLTNSITRKTSGFTGEKNAFHIQFGDILFYRWLVEVGLTPRKSLTIQKLKVPDEYFFDFLRGNFDGDGSIYAYWDPRWHSSYMFYVSFASASKPYLLWLRDTLSRLAGITGPIGPTKRALILRYAKGASLRLFHKMYYSENIPHLIRKRRKFLKFLKIDQAHK